MPPSLALMMMEFTQPGTSMLYQPSSPPAMASPGQAEKALVPSGADQAQQHGPAQSAGT